MALGRSHDHSGMYNIMNGNKPACVSLHICISSYVIKTEGIVRMCTYVSFVNAIETIDLYMAMANGVLRLRISISLYSSACGLVCTAVTVVYISLTCDSLTNIIYKLPVMESTLLYIYSGNIY